MNYIYDVVLNFKETLYDFYEWNINDNTVHFRRIPLIKINSQILLEIQNNKIKITNNFKNQIKNKTELFSKSKHNYYYSCLFCDGMNVIGITFNQDGVSILKSKMLLEEEQEVLDYCEGIIEKTMEYEIIKEEKKETFKTRLEEEQEIYIKQEISNIKNLEKLKYLYYECFNKTENNKKTIVSHFHKELKNNWDKIFPILYNFFKLTSINK